MIVLLKITVLVLRFSYYTLVAFLMLSVILPSLLMLLLSTRSLICDSSYSGLLNWIWPTWPRDTVDRDMKWLVDFNAEKTQIVSFGQSKSCSAIHMKIDGSFFDEKLSFKMLGFSFSSKLDWRSWIVSIHKLPPRNLRLWFLLPCLFLQSLFFIIYHSTLYGILLSCLGWCS